MPNLEQFLIQNRFTPEQIRFADIAVKRIFAINQSEKRGASEKEILEEFIKNGNKYSHEFVHHTLELLATTRSENNECAVLACVDTKWWCVSGMM